MSVIDKLKQIDEIRKPTGFDMELKRLKEYYEDSSHDQILSRLQEMRVGIKGCNRPLQLSMLRRIIGKLSVIYDRPPTRWLEDAKGRQLPENHPDHVAMEKTLRDSRYDRVLRVADKNRSLQRQVILRFYPSDRLGRVVLRTFDPFNVLRQPSTQIPDMMDEDAQFALRLNSGTENEMWEHWEKVEDGWRVRTLNQDGEEYGTPFPDTDGISPYTTLPAIQLYDEEPAGDAWLAPFVSRTSFIEAVSAAANDVWNLLHYESHTETVYSGDNPQQDAPSETGPGLVHAIPSDGELSKLRNDPHLREGVEFVDATLRWNLICEGLPVSEFDRNKQVLTGSARKVEMTDLLERRDGLIPQARDDERVMYQKFVAVNNAHKKANPEWVAPFLREDVELNVDFPDTAVPTDHSELLDVIGRGLATETMSRVDAMMMMHNEPRPAAIRRLKRVDDDNVRFPVSIQGAINATEGPRPTLPRANPVNNGANSVVAGLARVGMTPTAES